MLVFFFFKQKTAYEMRISDWSSDVCSSDLWIDPTTEEVLRRSAAGIPTLPVMMVTTHRPDWRADWATDFSHAASLSIGRLDRNQIAVLVGSILGARKRVV